MRVTFLCLLRAFLPSLTTLEWIDQQHFAKTKMRYISLPSNLNAIIGITNYYCVILQVVILHDAKKQFRISFLCYFKKNKNLFYFQRNSNQEGCLKTSRFFSALIIFQSLFVIFPWEHDQEKVTSPSVWLGVRRTPRVKVPGNEDVENSWHLNT